MADFPHNLEDDGEHWLPSDVISELFGSPNKMSHSTSPSSFSAKTTHDTINSHGKESLVRSANAKGCGGFSGPDYSYNSIPRGGGFVPWYGVFHPVPVLAGHIQLLYNPYPNQQEGPIETYDYPLTMFAPTTSQIQQGSGKAMMPVPVLHHHYVNNNNREEVEINAKCGGTGVFLPSKEIASTSPMKNSKPEENSQNTTTGGGDAVVSTRMRKKSGKIMQRNEKNNTMKEADISLVEESSELPPGIYLPEDWTY